MKVWIVFTEREWDWQTHKEIDSVHATEASAEACSDTLRNSLVEEHEVYEPSSMDYGGGPFDKDGIEGPNVPVMSKELPDSLPSQSDAAVKPDHFYAPVDREAQDKTLRAIKAATEQNNG